MKDSEKNRLYQEILKQAKALPPEERVAFLMKQAHPVSKQRRKKAKLATMTKEEQYRAIRKREHQKRRLKRKLKKRSLPAKPKTGPTRRMQTISLIPEAYKTFHCLPKGFRSEVLQNALLKMDRDVLREQWGQQGITLPTEAELEAKLQNSKLYDNGYKPKGTSDVCNRNPKKHPAEPTTPS